MHYVSISIRLLVIGVLCCILLPEPSLGAAAPAAYNPDPALKAKVPRLVALTPPPNRKILSFKKPDGSLGRKSPGLWEFCPFGSWAVGFSIKREPFQGGALDETSINGIKLICSDTWSTEITGDVGPFGSWSPIRKCCANKKGYLHSFAMAYDGIYNPKASSQTDDAGVDEIDFKCKSDSKEYAKYDEKLHGVDGPIFGKDNRNIWTEWSESCKTGICGIKTYVDPRQTKTFFPPFADHNGLHNVEFLCCAE